MSEPSQMKGVASWAVIEEDGKVYAVRKATIRGTEYEVYQRLEHPASTPPSKQWWGTKRAADRQAEDAAAFKNQLAAYRLGGR